MKKLFASAVLASSLLSGCAVDAVWMAYKAIDDATATQYRVANKDGVDLTFKLDSTWAEPFIMREFTNDYRNCSFNGALVPWARDWETVTAMGDSGQVSITPATPNETAGFVAIIYERKCEGKDATPIFEAGEIPHARARLARKFDGAPFIPSTFNASVNDMFSYTEEQRPKWFQQVVDRMIRLAPTNPAAKKVVAESKISLLKLYPEKADAIEVALK